MCACVCVHVCVCMCVCMWCVCMWCVCMCVCMCVCVCTYLPCIVGGASRGRGSPAVDHHGGGHVEGGVEVPHLLDEVDEAMTRHRHALLWPAMVLEVMDLVTLPSLRGRERLTPLPHLTTTPPHLPLSLPLT